MYLSLNRLAAALLVLLLSAPALHAQPVRFQGIGDLPGGITRSIAFGVSDDGTVVVGASDPAGDQFYNAVRWEDGVLTALSDEGYQLSEATDASADGNVIVGTRQPGSLGILASAVLWVGGGLVDIAAPPDHNHGSAARGVSADGSVVAGFSVQHINQEVLHHAWRWNGGFTLLDDLAGGRDFSEAHAISADGSVIVGYGTTATGREAVRWGGSGPLGLGSFPGDVFPSAATGVSADGSIVVGQGTHPEATPMAFRWANGQNTAIGIYEGEPINSIAQDVSGDGSIVVGYGEVVGAFIWTEEDGIRSIRTVLQTEYGVDLTGWSLSEVRAISADGRVIVGNGTNPDGNQEGWRAVLGPLPGTELVVNDTRDLPDANLDDDRCDVDPGTADNQCTLRAAIQTANRRSPVSPHPITFDIEGAGPHTIAIPTALDQIVRPVEIDGTTQPGYSGTPLIALRGSGNLGLAISAGRTTVRGLSIGGFAVGVVLGGQGNDVIEGCYIGVAPDGTTAVPNGHGVTVQDTPNHRIGGETASQRNVIAGNTGRGVWAFGANSGGTVIAGNRIGTNAAGTAALANGTEGIFVDGAPNVTIGGTTAGARNVIAGNTSVGVTLRGDGATGNRVIGNWLGLGADGQTMITNEAEAVHVEGGALDAHIGESGSGNVIVAEEQDGIVIVDLGGGQGAPNGTQVVGNTLGLRPDGSAALGEVNVGVQVLATAEAGGVADVRVEGNRIAALFGVYVDGRGSMDAVIADNTVGLLANGELARPDDPGFGIFLLLPERTTVQNNVVAGQLYGVTVGTDGATVIGNRIGTDPDGLQARPNTVGILVPANVATSSVFEVGDMNMIGSESAPNLVSGNSLAGIVLGTDLVLGGGRWGAPDARALLSDAVMDVLPRWGPSASPPNGPARGGAEGADGNVVAFNLIGTDATGTQQLGNGRGGSIDDVVGALSIVNGRDIRILGNLISGNGAGIQLEAAEGAVENTIVAGNVVGGSLAEGEVIPNQFGGIELDGAVGTRVVAAPLVDGGPSVGNRVLGNGGEFGVAVLGGEANQIRQSDFEGNEGPSIRHDFQSFAPSPPFPTVAAATAGSASFRLTPNASGPVDVFVSPNCTAGHADGRFIKTMTGEDDVELTISLPYTDLPGDGQGGAIGAYLAATNTGADADAITSSFSSCVRIADPANVTEAAVAEDQTGPLLDEDGLELEITANPPPSSRPPASAARHAAGTLYVARYDFAPDGSYFEGSATAPDGNTIVPNAVASARYWTLIHDGLEGLTYRACLDIAGLDAVVVPEQLLLVRRTGQDTPWSPFPSTLEAGGTRLCAEGLTAFGDLGIGADSLVNPVPIEPGPDGEPASADEAVPEAFALGAAYPNPFRGATTAQFAVEMPEPGRATVEAFDVLGRRVAVLHDGDLGAGTHTLRFEAADLPAGIYVLRATSDAHTQTRRVTLLR